MIKILFSHVLFVFVVDSSFRLLRGVELYCIKDFHKEIGGSFLCALNAISGVQRGH